MLKGSCNCGSVAFEAKGAARDVYMCHCSICRGLTGANGIAVLVVANQDFKWLSGEDQIGSWTKPDADWQSWFCRVCGSTLPGPNDRERMFIPAGLIRDGGDDLSVAHHIFVESKAAWDEIGDGGVQHPEHLKFGETGE